VIAIEPVNEKNSHLDRAHDDRSGVVSSSENPCIAVRELFAMPRCAAPLAMA